MCSTSRHRPVAADKAAKGCASRYSGAEQHSASLPECQVRGAPEGGEGLYTQGRGWTTWRIQAAHHTVKVVNTQLREAGDITVAKLGEVDQVIADSLLCVCAARVSLLQRPSGAVWWRDRTRVPTRVHTGGRMGREQSRSDVGSCSVHVSGGVGGGGAGGVGKGAVERLSDALG